MKNDTTTTLADKLSKTGWQSWSTDSRVGNFLKFPLFNFPPSDQTSRLVVSGKKTIKKPVRGWCSWYAFGWDINEEKILVNARKIADDSRLPLDYILIDGGWNICGDWSREDLNKFPNGIKSVAGSIKRLDLKPGIWMAPFLVDPKSYIAMNHPDWLVKHKGKFVEGLKLTRFDSVLFYKKWILDIKKKIVLEYLENSIEWLVEKCGFELLKLDFLYSLYFDPDLSVVEADKFLHDFLAKIRHRYPQVYTVACACPLLPAVGVVDSMRISPDTIISPFLKFSPIVKIFDWYLFERYVLRTIKKRLWTKEFWNVDLDAFVCRDSVGLSQKQILAFGRLIKEAGGNVFLGDDLTVLPEERLRDYVLPIFI